MKRFYLSIFILLSVVFTAISIHLTVEKNALAVIDELEKLVISANTDSQESLIINTEKFIITWNKKEKFFKAVSHHSLTENANQFINLLLNCALINDRESYIQACSNAKFSVYDIIDNGKIKAENILVSANYHSQIIYKYIHIQPQV